MYGDVPLKEIKSQFSGDSCDVCASTTRVDSRIIIPYTPPPPFLGTFVCFYFSIKLIWFSRAPTIARSLFNQTQKLIINSFSMFGELLLLLLKNWINIYFCWNLGGWAKKINLNVYALAWPARLDNLSWITLNSRPLVANSSQTPIFHDFFSLL